MREIKLRAWDKKRSRWAYFEMPSALFAHWDTDNFKYENYENWCQYTGLKDKNEKECYEGDKVLFEGNTYEVKWGHSGWTLDHSELDQIRMPVYFNRDCEITGNIYEN